MAAGFKPFAKDPEKQKRYELHYGGCETWPNMYSSLLLDVTHVSSSPIGLNHVNCSPIGLNYVSSSPIGFNHVSSSPIGLNHVSSSTGLRHNQAFYLSIHITLSTVQTFP